ncbi:HDOD domain-containing protein [Allochromatium warmingii]|uniref:HDOD domain-containing protein n=2 Tax=Allochromatium warmingii TaxID=61595 RepID=A0A1H3ECZ3_ALLWA|nr:HDOD domain-containing protein [Allochromatium warmingii]
MIRVMIVEDDPATGLLLRKLVKRVWPQAVITLDIDPVAALERWQQFGADLVLLDWELPGLSGLDILKAIRRSEAKTICAMITSHSDRGEILAARSHRIDAYIVKPFDAKQVMERLQQIMALESTDDNQDEYAIPLFEDFMEDCIKRGLLGLPITPELVVGIKNVREMGEHERMKLLRQCQVESALMFRMLHLANSSRYIDGPGVVETFDGAIRKLGLEAFINLAVEISWHPGSHIQHEYLVQKYFEIKRDVMSLIGILAKLREHVEFQIDRCRAACVLYPIAKLSLLQIMQAWVDSGEILDEAVCDDVLDHAVERVNERLHAQWLIPNVIRERTAALDYLPAGTVRKEPVIIRIAGLLHAGDPQQELPRLMARFGLGSQIDAN